MEDVCVREEVEVEPVFLGPPPPSSTFQLTPSVFQEKDRNLKYIFHSMVFLLKIYLNHHHQQQKMNFAQSHLDLFVQPKEIQNYPHVG